MVEREATDIISVLAQFELRRCEIQLDDPEYQVYVVDPPVLLDAMRSVWMQYNDAMIRNIAKLRRHVLSLKTWLEVLPCIELDDKRLKELLIDYIEPLLIRASDIPLSIRDQAVVLTGKITYLLNSDDDELIEVNNIKHNTSYWRDYRKKHAFICSEEKDLVAALNKLWFKQSASAAHLKNRHGERHHDIATGIESTRAIPMSYQADNGMILYGFERDEINLSEELDVIDEQRHYAQDVYDAARCYSQAVVNEQLKRRYGSNIQQQESQL